MESPLDIFDSLLNAPALPLFWQRGKQANNPKRNGLRPITQVRFFLDRSRARARASNLAAPRPCRGSPAAPFCIFPSYFARQALYLAGVRAVIRHEKRTCDAIRAFPTVSGAPFIPARDRFCFRRLSARGLFR